MIKTYLKSNGKVELKAVQLNDPLKDEDHLTMMSESSHSSRDVSPSQLDYRLSKKTHTNHDLRRMNAAINQFGESLRNSIMKYQAGDKTTFMQALRARNKKHFYVSELSGGDPLYS